MNASPKTLSCLILFLCSLGGASSALAQDDARVQALRNAGSETKFRVISSFPKPSPETGDLPRAAWLDGLTPDVNIEDSLVRALDEERWDDAWRAWKKLEPGADAPYLAFVRGVVAREAGDQEACFSIFTELEPRAPVELEDYVWMYRASCALELGKFHQATLSAARVSADSIHHADALFTLGTALSKGKTKSDRARAAKVWRSYIERYGHLSRSAPAFLSLGEALEEEKKWREAAEVFDALLKKHPLSVEAERGGKRLDLLNAKKLDEKGRVFVRKERPARKLAHLDALYDQHRSEQVIREGEALLKKKAWFGKREEGRCAILYRVAHSHTKLRKHSDSIAWYKKVRKECRSDQQLVRRALYKGGKSHWNAGNRKGALSWFRTLARKHASHSYADDAMFFSARILQEQGKTRKAQKMLTRQLELYPEGDMASDALWLLVRDDFAAGKYKEVVAFLDKLEKQPVEDLYSAGRLLYFKGRAWEKLGDREKALEAWRSVASEHPMGYYALWALHGMARLSKEEVTSDICALAKGSFCDFLKESEREAPEAVKIPAEFQDDPILRKGAVLLRLHLESLAAREFQRLRSRYSKDQDSLWALAMVLDEAGSHPLSHNIPRREIEGWRERYPSASEFDEQRWKIAYPKPFEKDVRSWSGKRELPPHLIWAIMREESGFSPGIESWANARGLLQLMKSTARRSASRDGLSGFRASQLFEPAINIRLGTAYMKELSDAFRAHPALIIAGYNGGEANVTRWLEEHTDIPMDLWVEDISYGQTRKYTKRVLTSFWTYAWLYGDTKVPVFSLEVPAKKSGGVE